MFKPSPTSDNICILCFGVTSKTRKIFDRQGIASKIAETLCQHFWFTSIEIDASKKICVKCWDKTSTFHQFYETVRKAHLHQKTIQPKIKGNDQYDGCSSDNHDNGVTMDAIADEDSDDGGMDTVQRQTPTDSADIEIKIEQLDPDINDNEDAKKISQPPRQPLDSMMNSDEDEEQMSDEDREEASTDGKSLDAEARIPEYFKMNCDLCGEQLGSLKKVTTHFSKIHKLERGYLICCCSKKVKMRNSVIEHVQWHMDPDMFRCEKCSKRFIDKSGLRKHVAQHHRQNEDPVDCSVCGKRFANQRLVTAHAARVHSSDNQKFTCDVCQKLFKRKVTLEAHIKYKHSGTNQEYICDICARVFSTKQNLQEHTTTHFDIPRLECDICGAFLKNKISLRIHKKIHSDTKKTCDICFEVKANQLSLNNHKRRVHGAANHKCNFCEKSFTRRTALREHIATHTGESLYTCKYCPQTFKSDANMYKHMKQVHPDQWANDRKKR